MLIATVNKMTKTINQIPVQFFKKNPLAKVYFSLIFSALFTLSYAQTAVISKMEVSYPTGTEAGVTPAANITNAYWCDTGTQTTDRSFWYGTVVSGTGTVPANNIPPVNSLDPTINSALIQFDQPFKWTTAGASGETGYRYPNHCLQLCVTVQCVSVKTASAISPTFPVQSVTFEVFKFLGQNNPLEPKESPPLRTIQLYPSKGAYKCAGYRWKTPPQNQTLGGSIDTTSYVDVAGGNTPAGLLCSDGTVATDGKDCTIQDSTNLLTFCGAWDGSYNFDSEFAKTNGQFGFRSNITTSSYQPDPNMGPVDFNATAAYPGMNQMPITVDLVDVHSLRTSPTVVGFLDGVAAQPYNIKYRISKDANVYINILDASDGSNITLTDFNNPSTSTVTGALEPKTSPYQVRQLIHNEPRLGERPPDGGQVTTDPNVLAITEVEPWDGRDDSGRLLPHGNYMVDVGAQATDQWGNDIALSKQYQMSLDPLKMTDITVTELNKQSTAYASIIYMLTEAATVYFQVYSPGTTFADQSMLTPDAGLSNAALGIVKGPTISSGTLVYQSIEQKPARKTVFTKWDGRCIRPDGSSCSFGAAGATYGNGEYLPDGDYVYVIWAEIPYQDANGNPDPYYSVNKACYTFGTGTNPPTLTPNFTATTTPAGCTRFDAVKTRMFNNGIMPVARGQVDVTIQAVGYSTMGSSPVAYGLDPFVFRYSISRDAPVTAVVKNTANVIVKTLVKDQVQVSQQMNQYTWDGKDDYGRFVSPGSYTFEVITKDPINPSVTYSQTALFPIDIFRIVDVSDTPLLDQTNSEAKLQYALTKTMDVSVFIYDKTVTIPNDKTAPTNPDGSWPVGLNRVTGVYTDPAGVAHVPIKTFRGVQPGEGLANQQVWDGTDQSTGTYVSDGQYPYIIIAKTAESNEATIYYDNDATPAVYPASNNCNSAFVPGNPATPTQPLCGYGDVFASDHVTGFINVTRGPVYFLDNSIVITPTNPKMFHSSQTINIPTYSIAFTPSRTAQIDISIISRDGKDCYGNTLPANTPQPVCRVIKNTNFGPYGYQNIFTGNISSKVFWDGKDNSGRYCANGAYTVKFQANGYPLLVNNAWLGTEAVCNESAGNKYGLPVCTAAQLATPSSIQCPDGSRGVVVGSAASGSRSVTCPSKYEATETRLLEGNLLQVFDTYIQDIPGRNMMGAFSYQLSTPMKVAVQIFKPGTYITNYQTGQVSNGAKSYILCQETPAQSVPRCTAAQLTPPNYGCAAGEVGNVAGVSPNRTISCTVPDTFVSTERQLLVKAITGMRTPGTSITEPWDGKDYAMQDVPDGIYPFRIVTALQNNSSHIDSFYGDIDDTGYVADWTTYGNFVGEFVVARGDGQFVCPDWKNTVIFFPNPLRAPVGKFEVTKTPVPGQMSIKIYNIAGDLVRERGYRCVDQNDNAVTMGDSLAIQPDNNLTSVLQPGVNTNLASVPEPNLRNAAVRCEWDKKNDHGKTVARGVYLGLVDFKATGGGKEHCQKVVKILIP